MKLMFLENRQQTEFWAAVAEQLAREGYGIVWAIQNPAFTPKVGEVRRLHYPKKADLTDSALLPADLAHVSRADRNVNYFGGTSKHYAHYAQAFEQILDVERPDVVFGEPTLFHERLCIQLCRRRGIPYFYAGSCRYPHGRFAFYLYDDLEMVGGSAEELSTTAAEDLLDQIVHGRARPDYMNSQRGTSPLGSLLRTVGNGYTIARGWLQGERFNTPSPLRKAVLQSRQWVRRRQWDRIAARRPVVRQPFRILLPMQMQPEASLDVWGTEWRDQANLIQRTVNATDEDTALIVKPNPRSKYELTGRLLQLVESSPRIYPVPRSAPMAPIFDSADLILTVTGTVAMEAVFHAKPVVTMSRKMHQFVPAATFLSDPDQLREVVEELRAGRYETGGRRTAIDYLRWLVRHSHAGWVSNPYSAPGCLAPENIARVQTGFLHLLKSLGRAGSSALSASEPKGRANRAG